MRNPRNLNDHNTYQHASGLLNCVGLQAPLARKHLGRRWKETKASERFLGQPSAIWQALWRIGI
jgi:hypothetical protein